VQSKYAPPRHYQLGAKRQKQQTKKSKNRTWRAEETRAENTVNTSSKYINMLLSWKISKKQREKKRKSKTARNCIPNA
jgi:hypothetical protein